MDGERPTQTRGIDAPERLLDAVDKHDRNIVGVLRDQRGVAVLVDVSFAPGNVGLGAHTDDDVARLITQVAADSGEQFDAGIVDIHAASLGTIARVVDMVPSDSRNPDEGDSTVSGIPVAEAIPVARVTNPETLDDAAPESDGIVAAFFDVDNTIIRGASSFHLARGLYSRGFFTIKDILIAGYHQFRYVAFGENKKQIDSVRQRALSIMEGHSVAEVIAIGEEVYDRVLSLRIYPGTREILDAHLEAGHEVWLITATPIEIGELIARRLGATGALGTVAAHKDGVYTGELVGDMMHGAAKERGVRKRAAGHGIDLAASYAYGDSNNDLAILSAVGHPCAINPEPRLRKHAIASGWPIRDFRGKRRIAKRGLKTASWAGAAWIVGLSARTLKRSLFR